MNEPLLTGKRIFVVEDDVTNMAIIAVTLKQSGAMVIQDPWNNGTIALLHRLLPVDIILLDLMLRHGKSGYDIFDEIRAIHDFAAIPILMVTAAAPEIEASKA